MLAFFGARTLLRHILEGYRSYHVETLGGNVHSAPRNLTYTGLTGIDGLVWII